MATQPKDDVGEIAEQLKVLREDFATLTKLVKDSAEARGDAAGALLARRVEEATGEAKARASAAQAGAEAAIIANPLTACAVSLGLGFLIGAVMRR